MPRSTLQVQFASPTSAIHGELAGRAPPSPLLAPLSAYLADKADISPGVQFSVLSHLKTAMSPEEGSLSLEACRDALEAAAAKVQRKSSKRKLEEAVRAQCLAEVQQEAARLMARDSARASQEAAQEAAQDAKETIQIANYWIKACLRKGS